MDFLSKTVESCPLARLWKTRIGPLCLRREFSTIGRSGFRSRSCSCCPLVPLLCRAEHLFRLIFYPPLFWGAWGRSPIINRRRHRRRRAQTGGAGRSSAPPTETSAGAEPGGAGRSSRSAGGLTALCKTALILLNLDLAQTCWICAKSNAI